MKAQEAKSRDMLRTTLSLQTIRKGDNSVLICDRVITLVLYTSSDDLLSMYQVLFNSLLYFQRYAIDKLNAAKRKVLYQFSFNSLVYFQRYAPDNLFILQFF